MVSDLSMPNQFMISHCAESFSPERTKIDRGEISFSLGDGLTQQPSHKYEAREASKRVQQIL